MKLIYHCYGSAHVSVVASAIHLGLLPIDRIATGREIAELPYYDKNTSTQIGSIFFVGKDEFGYEVYIMGMASVKEMVKNAINSFMEIYNLPKDELYFIDVYNEICLLTKIGGILCKTLHVPVIGKPLTIWGVQRRYSQLVNIVQETKQRLRELAKK